MRFGLDITEIIVAVVAFGGTLIGSYFANNKVVTLMNYRLDLLEKKQDKYNNVIERVTVMERDMKTVFNRIDELREDLHKN